MPKKKFKVRETKAKNAPKEEFVWEGEEVEALSDKTLEDDKGEGDYRIVRQFVFQANPEQFKERTPSGQELWNSNFKGVEASLWTDGLTFDTNHPPTLQMLGDKYRFIVVCKPARGSLLSYREQSKTLAELNDNSPRHRNKVSRSV